MKSPASNHRPPHTSAAGTGALIGFLTDRLTEDLAMVWARDAAWTDQQRRRRPGAAAQVAVLDDVLGVLGQGRLPPPAELRMLLLGYSHHPGFDARWQHVLSG